jgi:hypothetical protein
MSFWTQCYLERFSCIPDFPRNKIKLVILLIINFDIDSFARVWNWIHIWFSFWNRWSGFAEKLNWKGEGGNWIWDQSWNLKIEEIVHRVRLIGDLILLPCTVNKVALKLVVFKLCAAALWGAIRNSKGAGNFFRQYKIFKSFYRNLADFSI